MSVGKLLRKVIIRRLVMKSKEKYWEDKYRGMRELLERVMMEMDSYGIFVDVMEDVVVEWWEMKEEISKDNMKGLKEKINELEG